MALIKLDTFLGAFPSLHPRKLREGMAAYAQNVRLNSGALEPIRDLSIEKAITTGSTPQAIFKYTPSTWFEWLPAVDVVRALIPDDAYDRVIYTGDSYPRVTDNSIATAGGAPYPSNSYRLGTPAPDFTPVVVVSGTPTDPDEIAETRFYVITYVNQYGEEGPPSEVSNGVDFRTGQSITVTLPGVPTGNYAGSSFLQRIYRTNGVDTDSVFQYVTEVPISESSPYTDTVASVSLGEEMPSAEWDQAPAEMFGILNMDGGFSVGMRSNEVLFSEIGLIHAWPVKYRIPLADTIVGGGAVGNIAVIVTDTRPYILVGTHPGAMTPINTHVKQGCVSKKGIVSTRYAVLYPSPDGLVMADSSGARVITQNILDRDDWQALYPQSIRGFEWEGLYVGYYNGGQGAFIINPSNPDLGMMFLTGTNVGGGYYDGLDDALYLATSTHIKQFDDGSNLTYTYRSRTYLYPKERFRVVQVRADSYPVTVKVYVDGVLRATKSVPDSNPVRLDRYKRGDEFYLEVSGTKVVKEVYCATTVEELEDGA